MLVKHLDYASGKYTKPTKSWTMVDLFGSLSTDSFNSRMDREKI